MATVIPIETHELLQCLTTGGELDAASTEMGLEALLREPDTPSRDAMLGAILHGLVIANAPAAVLAGAIRASGCLDGRKYDERIRVETADGRLPLVVSGGGKKGRKVVNVSTPASIIAASAGVPIIKTGSSATSCVTGSADLATAHGIPTAGSAAAVKAQLDAHSFAFVRVESILPLFMERYAGRFFATSATSFGLGALVCPYEAAAVSFGVSHPNVVRSAEVLREFGIDDATVVSSTDDDIHFIDELLPWGLNRRATLRNGKVEQLTWRDQSDAPAGWVDMVDQRPTTAANAQVVASMLRDGGEPVYARVVTLNAALLLHVGNRVESLDEGVELAHKQIVDGHAWRTLLSLQGQ